MALSDPEPGFDPLRAQFESNRALVGFADSWEPSAMLEREAQQQRHAELPGGGVSWHRVEGEPDPTLDPFDLAARRQALGLPPLPRREAMRVVMTIDGRTVTRDEQPIDDTGEPA